jgi:protein ImuA
MRTIRHPGVIEELRERIRGVETARMRAEEPGVSTGIAGLDRLFPAGGLTRGTLIEWLGDGDGSGAGTLAMAIAAHLLRDGATFVAIDESAEFHPVAADQLGIPLDRTVVVRPPDAASALWTWEQALRCPGVAVTFGRIGSANDRVFRRFQVGVEAGGGWGFLMRPLECESAPSWAATRVCVEPVSDGGSAALLGRRLRVRVSRRGSGARVPAVEVDLPHEANPLPLAPQLAGPVEVCRSAAG